MSSIWTREELEAEITVTKAAIQDSVKLRSVEGRSSGAGGTQLRTYRQLKELRDHLNYLSRELSALDGRSGIHTQPMIPERSSWPFGGFPGSHR